MNPQTDQRPPQPPRSSFSCDRHPDDNFSGFCPSCLCERLTILDQSSTAATASSSSRRNSTSSSTAAAAIKSIFRVSSSSNATSEANNNNNKITTSTTRTSSLPELRRSQSFSASKNEELGFFAGVFEPQRKSCDVRGKNTLWSLFSIADENKPRHGQSSSTQQQTRTSVGTLLETNKEDEEEYEEDKVNNDKDGDEIRVSEEQKIRKLNDLENDIEELEAEIDAIVDNLTSTKDHIDLDALTKKPSLSNFWSAASVLSKKWHKWRRKEKKKNSVVSSRTLPVEKPNRETQSEIADYGFGRRSCDVDPRFSLDAGRVSFDDPRYSFDEPMASWDGYLIGRSFPRLPPMVENVPVLQIPRSDMQIPPVEEPPNPEDNLPGGSTQTRDYYLDSSSKRRKSLDRSNSINNRQATTTLVSNSKVSPTTIDHNHIHGRSRFLSINGEKEFQYDSNSNSNSNSNSLKDDGSETFDKETKKPRWWSRKLWGFINRPAANHGGEREGNNGYNGKLCRSDSNVSRKNNSYNMKKSNQQEGNEFVPRNQVNNGLLRFYLTPLKGSRRSGSGSGTVTTKSKLSSNSHSIAKNMLRFY